MTNDELQMTKEIRSSNVEGGSGVQSVVSSFGFGNCGSWRISPVPKSCIAVMNRWLSRAGRKAPINRTHSKRFARAAEPAQDASAFGVRASSAALSQGRLRFDGRAGSDKNICLPTRASRSEAMKVAVEFSPRKYCSHASRSD